MAMNRLQRVARESALKILSAGAIHKKWTPEQRTQWTRAFNALQRLAGKKMVINKRGLHTERKAVEPR